MPGSYSCTVVLLEKHVIRLELYEHATECATPVLYDLSKILHDTLIERNINFFLHIIEVFFTNNRRPRISIFTERKRKMIKGMENKASAKHLISHKCSAAFAFQASMQRWKNN